MARGASTTATVQLSAKAPAGGVKVTLSTSNALIAQVPGSVMVPAGATTATVKVTTSYNKTINSVSVRAHYAGVAKSAVLSFAR